MLLGQSRNELWFGKHVGTCRKSEGCAKAICVLSAALKDHSSQGTGGCPVAKQDPHKLSKNVGYSELKVLQRDRALKQHSLKYLWVIAARTAFLNSQTSPRHKVQAPRENKPMPPQLKG